MAKFRVATTQSEFTVECEFVDLPTGRGFGSGVGPNVMFYDTKVSGEKELRIAKAMVSAEQFVSAVRE